MDEYGLIRIISNVLTNNLYNDQEVLTLLSSYSWLKLTVLEDATTGDVNGCIRYGDDIFSFCFIVSIKKYFIVFANLESKNMRVFIGNQDGLGELEFDNNQNILSKSEGIIDFDFSGRRWEGGVIGNKVPHGWGVIYDGNGDVESECFAFDGKKVCFAKDYYPEIDRLKYEGTYAIGCRCGEGKSFDRNGNDSYDGMWYIDNPVGDLENPNIPVLPFLHNHLREISLGEADLNNNKYHDFVLLYWLINLTSLRIDDNGLPYVHYFLLYGLPNLQEMIIGNGCVTKSIFPTKLVITHCMKLKRIVIGQHSFTNTSHVILKGMNYRLKCIVI